MHRRSTLFATAVCAALAVAPPLGAQDGPDDGMEEDLTITLEPTNDSGIRGTAVLRDEPDAMGGPSHSVTLELTGLEPGGTYPAHVHSGTCATDGGVVTALVRSRRKDPRPRPPRSCRRLRSPRSRRRTPA